MAELVDEDVRRPRAVGGDGAVQAEDAAAAVGRAVGQDLDDVVRRVRGDVAERPVLEREDVALGVERVVGRADRRPPVDALRRPRDAGLRRGGRESPDVDVALPFLERRGREEHGDQPPRVALELAALARGVAVAENQQVELRRRIAALVQRDAAAAGVRRGAPRR